MDEDYKIFEKLNIIKCKIEKDLNIIKNLEYDSKIKSINQYNKQLFDKINEQEKVNIEGKNKNEENFKNLDMNLKGLENEIAKKNGVISDLYDKIKIKDELIQKKDSYIKNIQGN